MYVESAAELGILGIGGLLGMLIPTLRRSWGSMRSDAKSPHDPRVARAAAAIFLAIGTFMVGAVFLTAAFSPLMMFLASLGIAFQAMPRGENESARVPHSAPVSLTRTGGGGRRATRWQGRPATRVANRSA